MREAIIQPRGGCGCERGNKDHAIEISTIALTVLVKAFTATDSGINNERAGTSSLEIEGDILLSSYSKRKAVQFGAWAICCRSRDNSSHCKPQRASRKKVGYEPEKDPERRNYENVILQDQNKLFIKLNNKNVKRRGPTSRY